MPNIQEINYVFRSSPQFEVFNGPNYFMHYYPKAKVERVRTHILPLAIGVGRSKIVSVSGVIWQGHYVTTFVVLYKLY